MTDWPFGSLRVGAYGVILADPPWAFRSYTSDGVPQRAKDQHYPTMSFTDMAMLPVWKLAAPDCALLMWGISSHLPECIALGQKWGFEFKSKAFCWAKLIEGWQAPWDDGCAPQNDRFWHMGLGYSTRRNTEDCWLFTRGSPKRKEGGGGVRELIVAPVQEHSRKPGEIHDRIQTLYDGPYCELFSRAPVSGWNTWGNETEKFAV